MPTFSSRRSAAKLGQLAASLDGSPHVEELFSEHLLQARDLYQKYTAAYAELLAATIARVCRKQGLVLNAGMTPRDLARCVEMAVNGTKSAYPAMQPADAFLKDLEIMLRTLIAGAVRPAAKPRAATPKPAKKSPPIHRPQTWRSQMSTMTINGKLAPLPDDPDALLVDVVRDALDLTGTKLVCGAGVCGACTVLVDGEPVVSCLMPARSAANTNVTTVEGIGAAKLHPVQKAFMAHDALQCGFCTPGFIVEAAAFHDRWRAAKGTAVPSREEIGAALSGHLCRCGAYDGIFRAVADACAGRFDGNDILPPRMEARDKVTGSAKYTVDIHHDGQLEGVILRSPFAHARIGELDLAAARAMPGVSAAISLLGDDRIVRYVGEPIAAVAASDRKTALAAIAAIKLGSERLPSAIGLDEARKADAPVVFEKSARKKAGNVSEGGGSPAPWKGNIRGPSAAFSKKPKKVRSWVEGARAANNPLLVEGTFRTGTQQHACLEPHAAVARFDGDRLTVHVSTQAVFHVMELIAKRYKLGHDKVRVIADHVGGGFGSKAALGVETTTAIELAREAKAPVRVAYDRHEELSVTGYRPATEVKIALAAVRAGRAESAFADRLCRHRRRDQFDHRRTGAADLSGGSKRARRFRRHQQSAGRRAVPRPRRAADGVCAGAGDRRGGAAHEGRSDRAAQTLGSRSQPPAAVRLGPGPGRVAQPKADRRAERPLSPRRRRRHRLLALSVAARLESRSGGQGRTPDRQHRDAGYRHRHPHRDRQYGRARHSGWSRTRSRSGSAI